MGLLTKTNESKVATKVENKQVYQYAAVDIVENDNGFVLEVELPGVKKEDVKLDINGDVLTIAASRTKGNVDYQYERQFRVGNKVNTSEISAKYEHGLLSVELSKKETQKPRTIEIKA